VLGLTLFGSSHRTQAGSISVIRDLGPVKPTGVSNTGLVVGMSTNAQGPPQALVENLATGAQTALPAQLPVYGSSNPVISPNGTIAYANYTAQLLQNGQSINLGTVPLSGMNVYQGSGPSTPYGVNDSGVVVGQSYAGARNDHAFAYTSGYHPGPAPNWSVSMQDLDTMGGNNSLALGVNAAGVVVGQADDANWGSRAFVGFPRGDLGTLGGRDSIAYAINERNQVVGAADLAAAPGATLPGAPPGSGNVHAFMYQNSRMGDLGTLPGYANSVAVGINNAGQVIGYATNTRPYLSHLASRDPLGIAEPFLYQNGVMTNLNDALPPNSGWLLQSALAINDLGQIVGVGTHDGQTEGYVLVIDPVPEPAPLLLFATVAGGWLIRRGRRAGHVA
jgi:uncharacterized membrane protein